METKEYIVSTIRGIDIAAIDAEMTASTGSATIPNRSCEICNSRPLSTRQTHYHLTDAEAEALRKKFRLISVTIFQSVFVQYKVEILLKQPQTQEVLSIGA